MKVKIIEGPHTKERLQKCYQFIVNAYRKSQEIKKCGQASKMTTDHTNITHLQ